MTDDKFAIDKKIVGWRFGSFPFELYAQLDALMRADMLVPLPEAEKKILTIVVSHDGQTVSKDDIIKYAWPDQIINDSTMTMALHRLRDKLVDDIIETVPRHGLRLKCPTDPLGSTRESQVIHLTKLFTDADRERQTMPDAAWDRTYAPEIDKIRPSLAWALTNPLRRHLAVALFGATAHVFERLSLQPEARGDAERIVPLIDDYTPVESAARFFLQAGHMWRDADRLKALSFYERALVYGRKLKDSDALATLLGTMGGTRLYLGKLFDAQTDLEEAVKKLSMTERKKDLSNALNDLGLLYSIKNHPADAKSCFDRAIGIADSYNDTLRKYIFVLNLGEMEFNKGALDRAIFRCEEANRGLESAPNAYRLRPKVNLATYHALQGDFAETQSYTLEALPLSVEGDGYFRRQAMQNCALLAAKRGKYAYAAQLLGFTDQDALDSGEVWQKPEREFRELLLGILRENLSVESLETWLSEGACWSEKKAMAFIESHILPVLTAEKA